MKHKRFLIVFCGLLLPAMVVAQGHKIGVVNANRVVQESQKGKAFFAELDTFSKQKRDLIEQQIQAFREQEKDAQAKAASMSEDKAREVAIDLQKKQTDIKRMQEDAERESKLKLNEGLEKFQRELGPLIRQIALEKGLHLVLNDGPSAGIVYRDDAIDITNDVIKKYDEMNQ